MEAGINVTHRPNSTSDSKKLIKFILLSLLFHLALVLIPWPRGAKEEPPVMMVDRIILDPLKEQVVDDTKEANKETPDESRFLSKEDNKVEKETKAKISGKTKNRPELVVQKPKAKPSEKKPPRKKLKLADLGLKPHQKRNPTMESTPSVTDDYLPEVKDGAKTSLNTREFQFYSYFERIKDRLRMYWEPELKKRINQLFAVGQDLPNMDLITKLIIILDKNGELSKIAITRASGVEEIDVAAVKAFELASPFPNPPSGMVEADGNVQLTWSFVVETQGIADIFVFLSQR